jgi:general secretion pathway protein M
MNAALERFRAWWTAQSERDRRVVSAGAIAVSLMFGYVAIWQPVHHWRERRQQALTDARSVATRLEAAAVIQLHTRGSGPTPAALSQSLLAAVDQSARASNLGKSPTRIQPEGDQVVKVWLDDVSFDGLVRWLLDMQTRYGVRVDSADIERRSGAGLVNARLTLARGN